MGEHVLQRSSPTINVHQTRRVSHTARRYQKQTQKEKSDSQAKNLVSNFADSDYKHGLRYGHKSINLFKRDPLGMDSLGRPAEALILRSLDTRRPNPGFYVDDQEKTGLQNVTMNATEMLEKIDAEKGLVGAQRVAENIEEVRSTWLSALCNKDRPTGTECRILARRLYEGFMTRQLISYFGKEEASLTTDPDDLFSSYYTDLYARSSWTPGTTLFPRESEARYAIINKAKKRAREVKANEADKEQKAANETLRIRQPPKSVIVNKIIRERWRIRTVEDEEALGEIDIWPHLEHLELLLNHNQNILHRVSERYGAKINTSVDERVIRITAERATSGDVLKFVIYMLGRICHREVALPQEAKTKNRNLKTLPRIQMESVYREQLQRLTNTFINVIPGSKGPSSDEKVIIYFLGPEEEDFEDARRLLIQHLTLSEPGQGIVKYGASFTDTAISPVPVEVGNGLPLGIRSREWSRWIRAVKREENTDVVQKQSQYADNVTAPEDNFRMIGILRTIEKLHKLARNSHLKLPGSAHWLPKKEQIRSAVVIGRVIFPTQIVKDIKVAGKASLHSAFSVAFWRGLTSRREFLSSNSDLQPVFPCKGNSELSQKEYILIKMSPTRNRAAPAQSSIRNDEPQPKPPQQFPDLEIRLDVDRDQHILALKQVRAVFQTWDSDILLPHKPSDLQFVTQRFATASTDPDPRILSFIERSDLDLWGSTRLKTPPSLTLAVPHYSNRKPTLTSSEQAQGDREELVEYTFTGLEHKSELLDIREGFEFKYTVIEAGRVGGRREELRITAPSDLKYGAKGDGPTFALFDKAMEWIADMSKAPNSHTSLTISARQTKKLRRTLDVASGDVVRRVTSKPPETTPV